MIKNIQAIVQDAIGYSYKWKVVSSDCSVPIISTNLGFGTENNVAGDGTITTSPVILKNTITTLPDNCAVTIALEIFNTTNELCNQYYFDLESNIVNANYNWKCVDINDGYGCQQFAGLPTVAGEFDSEALCNECSDCPCNQDNVNEICDCVIDVVYDCNTSTLTVTNNSNIVDTNCLALTISDIFIENDIVYNGGTLLIGNSIVIPNIVLPNGTYYTSFTFVGSGLVSICNFEKSFLVNCIVGEINNIYCCNQIANDATGNVANINNKDGYILDVTGISNTLYIDFGYNMVADQIFVYTGIQDIDNLIPGDLIASTPPCGDINSCHNNPPCIDNITDTVVGGFWTGTGIYAVPANPGISGQTIGDRNSLSPAWSSELYDINIATHTNPGFLPTATGGGILAGQGRLAISPIDYINPSNKLTIVVYNNGSICPYNTPGCNNTYNGTAYKFIVVCPNCEQPEITVECSEIVTNGGNVLINTIPGEYTDFSIDISDKVCENNIYFAIDYNMGTVVDKLKIYYNNNVVASTPYVGVLCTEINLTNNLPICNNIASTTSTPDCYMSGFYLNTNIAPDAGKNSGVTLPITPVPILNPLFTFPSALAEGTGRLIVNVPYVSGEDTAVIRLINNYDVPGTCNTFWNISPVCLPCEDSNCCYITFIKTEAIVENTGIFTITQNNIPHVYNFSFGQSSTYDQSHKDAIDVLIAELNVFANVYNVNISLYESYFGTLLSNIGCNNVSNEPYTALRVDYSCSDTLIVKIDFSGVYTILNTTVPAITINNNPASCTITDIDYIGCDYCELTVIPRGAGLDDLLDSTTESEVGTCLNFSLSAINDKFPLDVEIYETGNSSNHINPNNVTIDNYNPNIGTGCPSNCNYLVPVNDVYTMPVDMTAICIQFLVEGNYTVQFTDNNGCIAYWNFVITCPNVIIEEETCCITDITYDYKTIYTIEGCPLLSNNISMISSGDVTYEIWDGISNETACNGDSLTFTTGERFLIVKWSTNSIYTITATCCNSNLEFTNASITIIVPEIYAPAYLDYCIGQTVTTQITSNTNVTYTVTGLPAGLTYNSFTGVITGTVTAVAGTYPITVNAIDYNYCDTAELTFDIVITNCGLNRQAEVDVFFGTQSQPLSVTWDTISTLGTGAFVGLPQSSIKINGVYGTYNSFNSNKLHDSIYISSEGNLYYDNVTTFVSSLYQNVLPYSAIDGSVNVIPNYDEACVEYTKNPFVASNSNGNTATNGHIVYECYQPNYYRTVNLTVNLQNNLSNVFIHCFDPLLNGGAGSLYGEGTVINSVTILQNNKYGGIAQIVPVNVTKGVGESDTTFALNIQNALNASLLLTDFTKVINGVETTLDCIVLPNIFINFNGELHQNAPQIINVDYINTHWIYNPNNDGSIRATPNSLCSTFANPHPDDIWTYKVISKPVRDAVAVAIYLAYTECDPLSVNDNIVLQAVKAIRINIDSYNNNLTYEYIPTSVIPTYPKNTVCSCNTGNDLYSCLETGNTGFDINTCNCIP